MNILFVSTDYVEPGRSSTGLPNYLRRIMKALCDEGHSVTIIYGSVYSQHRFEGDIEIFAVRIPILPIPGSKAHSARIKCLLFGYYLN